MLAAGLAVFDLPSQKAAWKPLRLVEAGDTPYGKLQVIRNEEQVTVFDNGLAVFSHPDEGAAEEAVHFALLQRDGPRRVLLVGGGASGGAAEALKYPDIHVDCVELDPAVIRLADKHLPGPVRTALVNPRTRVIFRDGRTFIGRTEDRYDAILLNLPEPATAQINRYYTREFFLQVRSRLLPGGVFSFVVPSAENYISQPLAQFLGSLAATLRGVFPHVLAVPGGNCVFLASDAPLSIDPGFLSDAAARLGLDLRYLSPGMLKARLDPARVDDLAGKLSAPDARINRDLVPGELLLPRGPLGGPVPRRPRPGSLKAAGRIAPFWILDLPLAFIALGLAALAAFRRRSPARFLVPVAVMGFTSIAVELAVFIAFQANFGFVYGKIPLLLASFMAGLVLGSLAARSRDRLAGVDLAAVQAAFVLLLLLTLKSLSGAGGELAPFALLFGFGVLGGYLFVAANRRSLPVSAHPGLAYGVDLLASFAGVILASGLIIPLFGIPALILRLTLLNALCFLYLSGLAPRAYDLGAAGAASADRNTQGGRAPSVTLRAWDWDCNIMVSLAQEIHVRRIAHSAEEGGAVASRQGPRHPRHRSRSRASGRPDLSWPLHGQVPALREGGGPHGPHRPAAQGGPPQGRRGPGPFGDPREALRRPRDAGRAARQPEEARQEPEPAPVEPPSRESRHSRPGEAPSRRPVRARSSPPCRRVSSSRSRYTASPI